MDIKLISFGKGEKIIKRRNKRYNHVLIICMARNTE